jgi:endonuclease/exonuclease/phosphatase family metal-dependent hydrolase
MPAAVDSDGLAASTVRVATWNVWANFGPWRERYTLIEAELRRVQPDIIFLQEAWRDAEFDAARELSKGMGYHQVAEIDWFEPLKLHSGAAILSRWPINRSEKLTVPAEDRGTGALFQFAEIGGPRGAICVFNAMLDWRPDLSHVRQRQVKALCTWIRERGIRGTSTILCGDFNAPPDADEIRMLTGKAAPAVAGLVFYDAWDTIRPEERGVTWSNANPYARTFPLPDRRIDYVFSAWGLAAGLGQPLSCDLLGGDSSAAPPASDHFGVWADLRY